MMDDKDLFHFYAGMALVGIISNRGAIDKTTVTSALQMACYMIDIEKEYFDDKDLENDK